MNEDMVISGSGFFGEAERSLRHAGESPHQYFRVIDAMPARDIQILSNTYRFHKKIVDASSDSSEDARPVCFIVMHYSNYNREAVNSSNSMLELASQYYDKIEGQLQNLADASDPNVAVEKNAVSSALQVISELKRREMAPPALSWHGGDAVVMLWALGETTYAITVTDGELGYVVRRQRKTVKLADSIKLDQFKLEDLR